LQLRVELVQRSSIEDAMQEQFNSPR